ncbi:Uncharacterized damage-inducible protein DinB (forms a four-helix bundle) [Pseudarcicella hirudinis]|uniref:Uncharacterized damage-inducible protein DinB (Forms a four-helix bundle) n=1 Tax=Pseudarcicella hirudinis TaxID=1079859 RepID=A0A1I5M2P8_9BACT|nr:DinB family protein [Pseudarcicella hirudinis]SFP03743.1 Uncharacterized damage-inducible protein DinB (forms a four-helix bundle) [Pseudarcicella hirudinis]
MAMIPLLVKEMEQEAQTTRKMLSIIPNDKFDWRPHPKSMTIRSLSTHIAELPTMITLAVTTDVLDFGGGDFKQEVLNNREEVLSFFEKALEDSKAQLSVTPEERLEEEWTMRNGDEIYFTMTKAEVIRMIFCQIVHHRAQLGVFLRLLDIPIPGSYGPSADEMGL